MKTMLSKYNEAQKIEARSDALMKYRCPKCGGVSPGAICCCDMPRSKIIKRPIARRLAK